MIEICNPGLIRVYQCLREDGYEIFTLEEVNSDWIKVEANKVEANKEVDDLESFITIIFHIPSNQISGITWQEWNYYDDQEALKRNDWVYNAAILIYKQNEQDVR